MKLRSKKGFIFEKINDNNETEALAVYEANDPYFALFSERPSIHMLKTTKARYRLAKHKRTSCIV